MQSQENAVVPQRTPEQEAAKQTEKYQQELNLTANQVKSIYEINLRYARERQQSNTRIQALVRMKNKNSEIQKVLDVQQKELLQTKRYENTRYDANTINRNSQTISTGFRSSSNFRSNSTDRAASTETNPRSTSRIASPQRIERVAPRLNGNSLLPTTTQPLISSPTKPSTVKRSDQENRPNTTRSSDGTNAPQKKEPASRNERK